MDTPLRPFGVVGTELASQFSAAHGAVGLPAGLLWESVMCFQHRRWQRLLGRARQSVFQAHGPQGVCAALLLWPRGTQGGCVPARLSLQREPLGA